MANTHYKPYIFDYMQITHQQTSLRIKNSKPAPIPLRNIRTSREKFTHHNEWRGFSNAEPRRTAEQRRIKIYKKFCALLPFPRHSAFQYPPIVPIIPITPITPITPIIPINSNAFPTPHRKRHYLKRKKDICGKKCKFVKIVMLYGP